MGDMDTMPTPQHINVLYLDSRPMPLHKAPPNWVFHTATGLQSVHSLPTRTDNEQIT